MSFAPGDYEFAVTADDGVRLYVDGVRVIDKWIDQGRRPTRDRCPWTAAHTRSSWSTTRTAAGRCGPARPPSVSDRAADAPTSTRSTGTSPDGIPAAEHSDRRSRPRARRPDARLRLGRGLAGDRDQLGPVRRALDEVGRALGRRLPVLRRYATTDLRVYVDNVPVVDQWTFGPRRLQRRQGRARVARTSSAWSTSREVAAHEPSSLRTDRRRRARGRRLCRRVLRQPQSAGRPGAHSHR